MKIYTKVTLAYLSLFIPNLLGVYSTSILINQLFSVYKLFIVFIPLLFIFSISRTKLKIVLSALYSALLILVSPALLLASAFIIGDLGTNNGLRKVYEYKLSDGYLFSIYRTRNEGALGGNDLIIYKEKKLTPGIIYRTKFKSKNIYRPYGQTIELEGNIINVPSERELRITTY
ncbi:hypothetical protein [Hymenobacter sp. GOD-10R]|uniref:hypothetical protein n=1 Tax=Hymenobacter sp. GOD-10R TaxID=3093922 RepID=UPI002D79A20B|nr:hypothetical protein [Hymenobacter sp. GOD-10R]WRQ27687.1 hypothetical protein SD425_21690 [Hymenobacter sp. GOD-10R]